MPSRQKLISKHLPFRNHEIKDCREPYTGFHFETAPGNPCDDDFGITEHASYSSWSVSTQVQAGGETSRDGNAQRLELMKESVNTYELIRSGDRARALKLQRDPAFRLGKQGNGDILEGRSSSGPTRSGGPRPPPGLPHRYAGRPDGEWLHEFTSLSTGTFTANQSGVPRGGPRARRRVQAATRRRRSQPLHLRNA